MSKPSSLFIHTKMLGEWRVVRAAVASAGRKWITAKRPMPFGQTQTIKAPRAELEEWRYLEMPAGPAYLIVSLLEAPPPSSEIVYRWWPGKKRARRSSGPPPAVRPPSLDLARARSVLGVAAGAGPAEVRKAWRRAARDLHPDAGGDEAAFIEAQEARDPLLGGRR